MNCNDKSYANILLVISKFREMKVLCIFAYLIPSTLSNINIVTNFLNNLEFSKNLNSIYILNIGNSQFSSTIIGSLKLPKIFVQNNIRLDYLNLTKFEIGNALKYHFNYEIMGIIIVEKLELSIIQNNLLKEMFWFSRDKILVIISENTFNETSKLFLYLYSLKFVNFIYLDIQTFKITKKFQKVGLFPDAHLLSDTEFKKETIQNVKHFQLKVACNRQFPFSYCFEKNSKIVKNGRTIHLINNFIQFINGTMKITIEQAKELSKYDKYFDLSTRVTVSVGNIQAGRNILNFELYSNILEKVDFLLVIPKASYIKNLLYVVKPFSIALWIMFIVFIMYGSSILTLTLYLTGKNFNFWEINS